jgi:hypothetical protein
LGHDFFFFRLDYDWELDFVSSLFNAQYSVRQRKIRSSLGQHP